MISRYISMNICTELIATPAANAKRTGGKVIRSANSEEQAFSLALIPSVECVLSWGLLIFDQRLITANKTMLLK